MKQTYAPSRLILYALLFAYAALVVGYSLATDLKGGPDETAHLLYIRTIAVEHSLPERTDLWNVAQGPTAEYEAHQPPLYYAVMAVPYAIMGRIGLSEDAIWQALRILGIAFGVVWILSVYYLARLVLGSERGGLTVAAFTALIPTSAYMAGVISNDIMVCMWFTWAMALIVGLLKDGSLGRRSSIALGAIIGAAVLTKATGLLLIPLFLVAVCVCAVRNPSIRRGLAVSTVTVLIAAGVVCGWWLVRCLIMYGTIQPEPLGKPLLAYGLGGIHGQWLELAVAIGNMCLGTMGYFWTPYWLVSPCVDRDLYFACMSTLSVLCALPFVLRLLLKRGLDLAVYGILLMAAIGVVGSWLRYALLVDFGANLQGRLFLPVASVIAITAVSGAGGWITGRVARNVITGAVLGVMFLANIFVVRCIVLYYAHGFH